VDPAVETIENVTTSESVSVGSAETLLTRGRVTLVAPMTFPKNAVWLVGRLEGPAGRDVTFRRVRE
jgi:hypothetical protein